MPLTCSHVCRQRAYQATARGGRVTRIVTTAYRYKRPGKKRKAVAIAGPAIVR